MSKLDWQKAKRDRRELLESRPSLAPWQVGWFHNKNGNYRKSIDGIWTTVFQDRYQTGWRWVRGGTFSPKLFRTLEAAKIDAHETCSPKRKRVVEEPQ